MTGPPPMERRYLHRTLLVAVSFSVLFALIFSRLVYLQTVQHDFYLEKARKQQYKRVKITPLRGSIYSASDQLLAVSMLRESAYMAPEFLRGNVNDPVYIRNLSREIAETIYESEFTTETLDQRHEIITERAESINRRIMSGSSIELTADINEDTPITLKGRVDGIGDARLSGEIDGRNVEFIGRVDLGVPVVLLGTGTGDFEIKLVGELGISRNVRVEGQLKEGGMPVSFKGSVKRRGDFILKRKLPEPDVFELIGLMQESNLPTNLIYFVKESKRFYPNDALASHIVGYTTSDEYGDNKGLAGIERSYDEYLAGKPMEDTVEVTVFGQGITPVDDAKLTSATGASVYLTINEAIQNYAQEALAEQVKALRARDGACVVMNVKTGAVMAMASYPTFNPNDRRSVSIDALRNRCVIDSIPPGSVMKIFTLTTLLENNLVSPYEMIDCEGGRYVFQNGSRRRAILDSHALNEVSVHEAFAESSNIAFVKLGLRIPPETFSQQLRRFGFGEPTGIDLPGEGDGILHPLSRWNWDSRVSLSFGYELTLTPLQVAAAASAIANGGRYMQPYLVQEVRSASDELLYRREPRQVRQVCSPQTSRIVLSMMEEVVTQGTGKAAALPGFRVGGKTGTTVKTDRLESEEEDGKRYIGSFAGVFPIEDPQVVIYVWINEPETAKYGSTVAAPVFRKVAEHCTRILALEPTTYASVDNSADVSEETLMELPRPTFSSGVALPAIADAMPDLRGLTMREVVAKLQQNGIDAQLVGSGVAVRQQPLPGHPVGESRCLVVFGNPNPE